jgi:hypothetical protein
MTQMAADERQEGYRTKERVKGKGQSTKILEFILFIRVICG